MNHAKEIDFESVKEIFYQHKKWFPHIRTDYMKRMIAKENLIFDNDVVITYNFYKRKQRIGDIIRIHMPIRTNEQVIFTLYENNKDKDGTEYNLETGHYYYTDVTKAHAVRNTSNIDRIHLVADCYSNEKMRALLN